MEAIMDEMSRPAKRRVQNENGDAWDDPTPTMLKLLLQDLGPGNEFLVYERESESGEDYIQTAVDPDGGFVLEYRAGSADEHYSVGRVPRDAVHAAFVGWAEDRPGWNLGFQWAKPFAA
jgi:hypothetical protein